MTSTWVAAKRQLVATDNLHLLAARWGVGGILKIWQTGRVTGNGSVMGNVASSGLIAPGNSTGTLNFSGNLTLDVDSLMQLEVGGTTASQIDQVLVTGQLTRGGNLEIEFVDGFCARRK